MKIIDAHIHYCLSNDYFDTIAQNAGHENTKEHLTEVFNKLQIEKAVVMGNYNLDDDWKTFPGFLYYCVGLDQRLFTEKTPEELFERTENHLKNPKCTGIKLYPGYSHHYITDKRYFPFYELAETYHKPVAVHTGATSGRGALLKYCHPLTIDEVAVAFPGVQFVICHLGNPWITDAAAVLDKNENVAADLSGILEGKLFMPQFIQEKSGYLEHIKTWLNYLGDYDKIMYGTDWPLANMENYIDFTKEIIPEKYWEAVFYHNAGRIYFSDAL